MNEFRIQIALLKALATEATDNADEQRYRAGFLFGLGAAEEMGEFESCPLAILGFVALDPFLVGTFDGRAGHPAVFAHREQEI